MVAEIGKILKKISKNKFSKIGFTMSRYVQGLFQKSCTVTHKNKDIYFKRKITL